MRYGGLHYKAISRRHCILACRLLKARDLTVSVNAVLKVGDFNPMNKKIQSRSVGAGFVSGHGSQCHRVCRTKRH